MTRQEELDAAIKDINDRWDKLDPFTDILESLNLKYFWKDKTLYVVQLETLEQLSGVITKIPALNESSEIGFRKMYKTPYKFTLSNGSHHTIPPNISLSYTIQILSPTQSYGIYITTKKLDMFKDIKVGPNKEYNLLRSGTCKVPHTAFHFYPGVAAHEINNIRVPAAFFTDYLKTQAFYGDSYSLIDPDQIAELINSIHENVHTPHSDEQKDTESVQHVEQPPTNGK